EEMGYKFGAPVGGDMGRNPMLGEDVDVTRVVLSTSRGTLVIFKGGTHEEALRLLKRTRSGLEILGDS
ncbi:hypothetical protein OG21DRAFT_1425606, partial [Imleria badia]